MTSIKKFRYLLTTSQKKQLIILAFLLLIGMLFEMAGLGVLLPALGLMLKADIVKDYPSIRPVINFLGNPSQKQLLLYGMGLLIMVYVTKTIYLIFLGWKQSKFTSQLSAELSEKLFLGYMRQPYTFHLQRNSAELLRNIQAEVGQFTTVSQSAVTLTSELSVISGVAFLLILAEPIGAISVTLFLGLTAFGFHRLTRNKLLKWGVSRQFHAGHTNQHLLQGLGGVKDIKLMGREENFLKEFSVHNRAYARILLKTMTLSLAPRFYLELFAVLGLVGLILAMVLQNKPLELLIPTIGIFVAAAFRMIPSLNRIMSSMQTVRYTQSTVDVLYKEMITINESSKNGLKNKSKLNFTKLLEGKSLTFSYNGAISNAIDNVNISIRKGHSVGFIGASGSGKSTLVDLLLGLLEPENGEFQIDGQNMKENIRNWQDKIGYVPQAIYLIDDSLRKNVAFGIPDEQIDKIAVMRALKAAQLDEFVNTLPEKLETFVGERGVRLSGGQRQRIGIARALYHDPEVLVLDEATSALDNETEKGVMSAVNALQGNKTIIIVAHRLTTVEMCDYIYKLDKGRIIQEGIPVDLIKMEKF